MICQNIVEYMIMWSLTCQEYIRVPSKYMAAMLAVSLERPVCLKGAVTITLHKEESQRYSWRVTICKFGVVRVRSGGWTVERGAEMLLNSNSSRSGVLNEGSRDLEQTL